MVAKSEIILSSQTHPDGTTVESVVGEKFKGDGYYGRSDGIHTVQYIYSGLVGTIKIQGTLAIDPHQADWVTIPETVSEITEDSSTESKSLIKNFVGNFVWIRAEITNWSSGTVNYILLSH